MEIFAYRPKLPARKANFPEKAPDYPEEDSGFPGHAPDSRATSMLSHTSKKCNCANGARLCKNSKKLYKEVLPLVSYNRENENFLV